MEPNIRLSVKLMVVLSIEVIFDVIYKINVDLKAFCFCLGYIVL
jgi:hypothetical protein